MDLSNDHDNAVACEVLTRILDKDEILNSVLATIPRDWKPEEECETKFDFAFAFLWEVIVNCEKE